MKIWDFHILAQSGVRLEICIESVNVFRQAIFDHLRATPPSVSASESVVRFMNFFSICGFGDLSPLWRELQPPEERSGCAKIVQNAVIA